MGTSGKAGWRWWLPSKKRSTKCLERGGRWPTRRSWCSSRGRTTRWGVASLLGEVDWSHRRPPPGRCLQGWCRRVRGRTVEVVETRNTGSRDQAPSKCRLHKPLLAASHSYAEFFLPSILDCLERPEFWGSETMCRRRGGQVRLCSGRSKSRTLISSPSLKFPC